MAAAGGGGQQRNDSPTDAATATPPRWQVELLQWQRPLGAPLPAASADATPLLIRPANLLQVLQPPPALLVAYAHHMASDRHAHRFAQAEMPKALRERVGGVGGAQNIRCSQREIHMFVRVLDASAAQLTLSPADRRKLLGDLDPQWRVAVITPCEPPKAPELVARKVLREEVSCRHCAAAGGKLSACQRCMAVYYCGKECQRADWKARHKLECVPKNAVAGTAALSSSAGGSAAAGGGAAAVTGEQAGEGASGSACTATILVDIVKSAGDGKPQHWFNMRSGMTHDSSVLPTNLHGDADFVVKAQNAFKPALGLLPPHMVSDAVMFAGDVCIYDQAKSLVIHVDPAKCPEQHAALVRALKQSGRPGALNPCGRKVYLYARRVGPAISVVVEGRLPPQEQRW